VTPHQPGAARQDHAAQQERTGPPAPQGHTVLQATTLLAGRTWVGIEHNGQHYRLQTTRAGKLILTK
jgi:hemin uptake protein HemP